MDERGEVTRALLAIARDVADDRAVAEQICRACVANLDIDGAATSLSTASASRDTLYASDATADLLDELQFTLGEGACMEAAVTGRPVLVPDMGDTTDTGRWPVFAAATVGRAGVGAIFALPLQWGTVEIGVLDLYRRSPGSLSSVGDTAAVMIMAGTLPGVDARRSIRPPAWSSRSSG